MKSIRALLLQTLLLITTDCLFAQDKLFYFSIQGNWDKQRQTSRAQFAGNNKLINNYFNNFTKELLFSGSDAKGTGEISFVVKSDGSVDSLAIHKGVGQRYDSAVYKILQSMSGKWRPELVAGAKSNVRMTIWYNVYKGPKSKKTLEEFVAEANKSIEAGDFKKALRNADHALEYDVLNVDAIVIKTRSLASLNGSGQACEFIKLTHKYDHEKLVNLEHEYCK